MTGLLRAQATWLLMLATVLRLSIAEAATPRVFVVELPVRLDTVNAGKLLVGLSGEQLLHVELESWQRFAAAHLLPETLAAIAARAVDGRLSPEVLREAGVGLRYDPATLVVDVELVAAIRVVTELSLRRRNRGGEPAADPFSAYANLRASQGFVVESDAGRSRNAATVGLDGAARFGGAGGGALEWSAAWREGTRTPVRRGDVRLIHDDIEGAIRYSAGDVLFGTAGQQGRAPWAGVAMERQYSRLQPFRVITTTGQQSFTLDRPSRIDIYINGQFQNTSRLLPGRYSLSDFAFLTGLNDVQIVVEDDAGQRTTLDFTLFLGAQLLAPGISEFAFSGGLQRRTGGGQIAYDTGAPGVSGYYRRGVYDWLTLGSQYQAETGLQQVGLESTIGTRIGLWALNAAGSSTRGVGRGWAGTLNWNWNFSLFSDRRSEELSIVGQYVSGGFRRLGARDQESMLQWQTATRLSTRLPFGTALSASWRFLRQRDPLQPIERAVSLALSKQLFGLTVSLRGEQVLAANRERRVYANLSLPLGTGNTLQVGYDNATELNRVDYSRFAQDSVGNLSGRAQFAGNQRSTSVGGDLAYRGNRALLRAQHSVDQPLSAGGSRTQRSSAQLETALAYTDGSFAVGRPIADAFAILRRHPTLQGSEVEAKFGIDGVIAKADRWGPAVVGTLDSYRPQGLQWSAPEAPAGYDLGDVARIVTPALYSGRAYTVGSAASITAVGVARHINGEPLARVAATIRADDGRAFGEQRSFTNRNGRFAVSQLSPGRYRVEFATEVPRTMRFAVSADATGYLDLGTLVDAETDRSEGLVDGGDDRRGPSLRLDERWNGERRRQPLPVLPRPPVPMLRTAERLAALPPALATGAVQ